MYGLVNKAVQDLVIEKFGMDQWLAIKKDSGISVEEFTPLDTYPDALTYSLVASASKILNLSPEDVLKAFGKYWIKFTADEGYGELMDLFGQNFRDCLANLNQMHSRMGAMMPHLKPPKFEVEDISADTYQIEYFSTRVGLAPMVYGLLEGLAEKHGEKIAITFQLRAVPTDPDVFTIKIVK